MLSNQSAEADRCPRGTRQWVARHKFSPSEDSHPMHNNGTMLPSCLPSHAKSNLFRFLRCPRRLFLPNKSSPSRDALCGQYDTRCTPHSSHRSQSLLPGIDLSLVNSPGTPSEQLVAAVQNLKPVLLSEFEVLGEGDLKITGPYPVSGDGFAEVWVGEMKDGTRVAIRSQRCHSSSSCLPAFLVSCKRYTTDSGIFSSPDVIYRGCARKH